MGECLAAASDLLAHSFYSYEEGMERFSLKSCQILTAKLGSFATTKRSFSSLATFQTFPAPISTLKKCPYFWRDFLT